MATESAGLVLPPLLQQRAGPDWDKAVKILREEFDLDVVVDNEGDVDLFLVSYKHGSKLWDGDPVQKLVQWQSRGAIFSRKNAYSCVCLPFLKFWGHEERHAQRIDEPWGEGVEVLEKLDGAILKFFFYGGKWNLASNTKLTTDTPRKSMQGRSHWELFEECAERSVDGGLAAMMARLEPQNCYVFERCHPDAVVVVPYRCPQLFHIGTRDMNTLHELRVDIGVPKPKCFPFGSLKEAFAEAAVIPWNLGEGFVVTDWRRVDSDGPDHSCRRVKVKSLSYLRVHHGITNTLVQDPLGFCLETWLSQEHSEILAAFPQFEPPYSVVSGALQTDVVEAGTAAYNALTDSSAGQRPHFFKTLSSEDFDGFPKALVPLLKHHASLCKGEVLMATECSQLADTLRTRGGGGRFLHQATLKKFLLSRLPAEVLNVELLGKRGVHGARGAAAQQALAAEPDQTP